MLVFLGGGGGGGLVGLSIEKRTWSVGGARRAFTVTIYLYIYTYVCTHNNTRDNMDVPPQWMDGRTDRHQGGRRRRAKVRNEIAICEDDDVDAVAIRLSKIPPFKGVHSGQ